MDVKDTVKSYYSETLQSSDDLKTSACCASGAPPKYIQKIISQIHEDVLNKFYGCGFPITEAVNGVKVLDLGSGSGRDVYTYSSLVGENGFVYGIDMTDSQLATARDAQKWQAEKFGHANSNVEFIKGDIEDLATAGIADNSIDVVVSNCVVNLADDKSKVMKEIVRVLKDGGEFYFSDIFADRRLPEDVAKDPVLYGECLGGALYYNDFEDLAKEVGFIEPRIISESVVDLNDDVRKKAGNARFISRTYRLFKINDLDTRCEDYGQFATYLGTIPHFENLFIFDNHHYFEVGRSEAICANTAKMISRSRFAKHFKIQGDEVTHFGQFSCEGTNAWAAYANDITDASTSSSGSCC